MVKCSHFEILVDGNCRFQTSQNTLKQSLNECEKLKKSRDDLKDKLEAKEASFVDEIASLKQVHTILCIHVFHWGVITEPLRKTSKLSIDGCD